MKRKRHTAVQIIRKLMDADRILISILQPYPYFQKEAYVEMPGYRTWLITFITFLALPTPSSAQSRNIDIGSVAGVPSDNFAGLGVPGPWEVLIPDSSHVDFPETDGELERLLDDFKFLIDVVEYKTFVDLDNGTYCLITYAWGGRYTDTCVWTKLDFSDAQCGVGGPWPGQLQLGVTHTQHLVEVTDGTLRVFFVGGFGFPGVINGFQIIKYEDIRGACCDRQNGSCIDQVRQSDCTGDQPVWHIDVTCSEILCDPALGACCNTRFGTCTEVILADCTGTNLNWVKGDSCNARSCPDPFIPAVSEWGLVNMTLLLLIGAKIYFGRRKENRFNTHP